MTSLAPILQQFFTTHLAQRSASPRTISTYRDAWRIFLTWLADDLARPAHTLELTDITACIVMRFLDHLEGDRGNSISTRNLRLAAIKSVIASQCVGNPESLDTLAQIMAIPVKRQARADVSYLTEPEVQALLDAIPITTWTGRRDRALFALAAQTGLRISELIGLTPGSLSTGVAPAISCLGKGRKQRTTPLTRPIADLMADYIDERATRPGQALFPNPHGTTMSPDAMNQRLRVHLRAATTTCPSLNSKHVTVHTLRHTAAMRFLAAGIDASVIALWLGHESTATTSIYLHADMRLKQDALDRTRQPDTPVGLYQPDDPLLSWLENL